MHMLQFEALAQVVTRPLHAVDPVAQAELSFNPRQAQSTALGANHWKSTDCAVQRAPPRGATPSRSADALGARPAIRSTGQPLSRWWRSNWLTLSDDAPAQILALLQFGRLDLQRRTCCSMQLLLSLVDVTPAHARAPARGAAWHRVSDMPMPTATARPMAPPAPPGHTHQGTHNEPCARPGQHAAPPVAQSVPDNHISQACQWHQEARKSRCATHPARGRRCLQRLQGAAPDAYQPAGSAPDNAPNHNPLVWKGCSRPKLADHPRHRCRQPVHQRTRLPTLTLSAEPQSQPMKTGVFNFPGKLDRVHFGTPAADALAHRGGCSAARSASSW